MATEPLLAPRQPARGALPQPMIVVVVLVVDVDDVVVDVAVVDVDVTDVLPKVLVVVVDVIEVLDDELLLLEEVTEELEDELVVEEVTDELVDELVEPAVEEVTDELVDELVEPTVAEVLDDVLVVAVLEDVTELLDDVLVVVMLVDGTDVLELVLDEVVGNDDDVVVTAPEKPVIRKITLAGEPADVVTNRSFVSGSTSRPNGPGLKTGSASCPKPDANSVSIGSGVPSTGVHPDMPQLGSLYGNPVAGSMSTMRSSPSV
jgi:hypothetical protein